MTLNQLSVEVARREGKKSQVSIGNIREILRILCDIDSDYYLRQEHPVVSAYIAKRALLLAKRRKKKEIITC